MMSDEARLRMMVGLAVDCWVWSLAELCVTRYRRDSTVDAAAVVHGAAMRWASTAAEEAEHMDARRAGWVVP